LFTVLAELKQTHQLSCDVLYQVKLKHILRDSSARRAWNFEDLMKILMGMVRAGVSEDLAGLTELYNEAQLKARHGLNIHTARDMLWTMAETNFVSFDLVAAFEDMLEKSVSPPGLFDQATTASVLKAYAHLRLDFSRIESLVSGQVLPNKFQDFEDNYKVRVAYEMARLDQWDPLLWRRMLTHLAAVDCLNLSTQSALLSYHLFMILDLLAPQELQPQVQAMQALRAAAAAAWTEDMMVKRKLSRVFVKPSISDLKLGQTVSRPLSALDDSTSPFTKKFAQILANYSKTFTVEYLTLSPYSLDVDIYFEPRTVIELQGPTHYLKESFRATGGTVLKTRLLEKLNYQVIEIPYYVWDSLTEQQKLKQVTRILRTTQPTRKREPRGDRRVVLEPTGDTGADEDTATKEGTETQQSAREG
jgi:hypothetical protein